MRILSLILLAFTLLAPMQANSAQRKPDIPDGEIGKNLPWFSNTGSANDENYGNPDRTPKPLPKPGGLVGGIAGSIIIDTLVDVVDKGLDKVLDPNSHTPERFPVNGCGSYGDVRTGKGVGLADYAGGVCQHHYQDSRFELKRKVFMQSGKGVTYYLQCTKHPFSFSVSCYAYDEVINPDPNSNPDDYFKPTPTPTTPNNPATNPNNSPNDNPNSDPNNNPNPNTNPNTNPQNDPNSDPNNNDGPQNDPNSDPNNNPDRVKPKTDSNKKDDKEQDKEKEKDDKDKEQDKGKEKEKPFELPKFCSWASKVCDYIDWVKKEPEKEKTELDIEQQTTPNINTNIKFNAQCPNDVIVSGNWQGQTISITLFEWSKYCDFLIYLKYIIIAMASYGAVKIVGGVNVSD